MTARCICGCGARAVHKHHAFLEQWLKRQAGRDRALARRWLKDPRILLGMSVGCHLGGQHSGAPRRRRLKLRELPDSVYDFARGELELGPAYNHLRSHYDGEDPRLDALLERAA